MPTGVYPRKRRKRRYSRPSPKKDSPFASRDKQIALLTLQREHFIDRLAVRFLQDTHKAIRGMPHTPFTQQCMGNLEGLLTHAKEEVGEG